MKTTISATHAVAAGVIAGAFALGFLSGPALAAEPQAEDEKFEFKFEYDAAELGNPANAKQMLKRLERKVSAQCAKGKLSPSENRLVRMCIDQTMANAVENFGSAALAEAYKSRAGG
jgi:UrcA family protein